MTTGPLRMILAQRGPSRGGGAQREAFQVHGCECRFTEPLAPDDRKAFFLPCERHRAAFLGEDAVCQFPCDEPGHVHGAP